MTKVEAYLLMVVGVVLAYVVACQVYISQTRTACLDAGYPEFRIPGFTPFAAQHYCVKRVNQTDIVVRLDSLERAK